MTRYAIRTCHECGIRKPQPEMKRKEIYVEVAKSKRSISGATIAGLFLADRKSDVGRKSAKAVTETMFNTGERVYKRKRIVWACSDCAKKIKSGEVHSAGEILRGLVVLILIVIFVIVYFGGPR